MEGERMRMVQISYREGRGPGRPELGRQPSPVTELRDLLRVWPGLGGMGNRMDSSRLLGIKFFHLVIS